MSSNRLRLLLVSVMAVFVVSAVASASASATCYKVAEKETGNRKEATCGAAMVKGEFIKIKGVPKDLNNGKGELCGEVEEKETGNYATLATCEAGTPKVAKGEFIRVLENENEQQRFSPGFVGFSCSEAAGGHREYATDAECEKVEGAETVGGKWHRHTTTFASTEGVSTLTASGVTVTCQKDTDKGELWGKESVANVVVTFKECKGKKGTEECKVKSKGATGAEEVVTNTLKGELGEVAAAESATGVGLLLEGESPPVSVFVTLEGTCLPAGGSAVEGSVVGEVTPVNTLQLTDEVIFEVNAAKEQKIKTFERSLAEHCGNAPAARKCSADFAFKPKLEAFTELATFVSADKNTFSLATEVLPGV